VPPSSRQSVRSTVNPDVVLYDVIGLHDGDASELDPLRRLTGSVVIAVSYDWLRRDLEALALDRGATGVIPLSTSPEELAEVIRAAVDGRLEGIPTVPGTTGSTRARRSVCLLVSRTCWLWFCGVSTDRRPWCGP